MKKSWIKRGSKGLSKVGKSETTLVKIRIQALLRQIVMVRDGGCLLRDDFRAGECGGYRKDGELILQADHLHSRVNNISFGDSRLVVCLCKRHHGYFKPQYPMVYYELIRQKIGQERWDLLQKVSADKKPYPMGAHDWGVVELALKQELKNLST